MEEQKQVHPHITPTVGRVVWFWDNASDGDDHPMRADICFVNEDGTVNLSVNDHRGESFVFQRCTLHQGDAEGCSLPRPFATWMPYQKGQAAKTEAAEKAAAPSYQTEHERLTLASMTEQVREMRLRNDQAEALAKSASSLVASLADAVNKAKPADPGMPPHMVRVKAELDDLTERLARLRKFVCSPAYVELPDIEQRLLVEQDCAMTQYISVLRQRLDIDAKRRH